MKKLVLLMIPASLALAGCNFNNTGISQEDAKKIAEKIDEEVENITSTEFHLTNTSASGKGESRVETNVSMELKQNIDGTYYLKNTSRPNVVSETLHVFDETYEEVIFTSTVAGEETHKEAIVKKDNPTYDLTAGVLQLAILVTTSMYTSYIMPGDIIDAAEKGSGQEGDFVSTYTFESSGEKNLVIKGHSELRDASTLLDSEETLVASDFVLEYDNLRLAKVTLSNRSNYENESKYDISVSYSDTPYSITLPADWANYIKDTNSVK